MSAESEALHAIIEGDFGEARLILNDFSDVELREFADQLGTLRDLVMEIRDGR